MIDVHFSSKTDLWATPQDFFDKLHAEFGFNLDVCATPDNAKCSRFFTKLDDGLAQEWSGVVWMNPPYGREIGKWMKKADESARGGGDCGVSGAVSHGHTLVARSRHARRGALRSWPSQVWWRQVQCSVPVRSGCVPSGVA